MPFFGGISVGDRLALLFVPDGADTPPYSLKIRSPSGALVLDTLVRAAPTGAPQSPPPIEFIVDAKGRGKGIGGKLIQKAIEEAKARGCYEIQLNLQSDSG